MIKPVSFWDVFSSGRSLVALDREKSLAITWKIDSYQFWKVGVGLDSWQLVKVFPIPWKKPKKFEAAAEEARMLLKEFSEVCE